MVVRTALCLVALQATGLSAQAPELRIRFIGNEGFELSDGETTPRPID